MPPNDTLYDGKPNACSREFMDIVQSLEGAEQHIGIFHIESHAIVFYEKRLLALLPWRDSEFNARLRTRGGELPGIAEQIVEHNLQERWIAKGQHAPGDAKGYVTIRLACLHLLTDALHQRAKIDSFAIHLSSGHAR